MPLPPAEVATTLRWLDELDEALGEIADAALGLHPDVAASVSRAARDVAERVAHFRRALAGRVELAELLPSRWVPLGHVDIQTAEQLGRSVCRAASLPPEVVEAAHTAVTEENDRRAFLRQVGEVAGVAFVNLARVLWEDHPHLAPPGWRDSGGHV